MPGSSCGLRPTARGDEAGGDGEEFVDGYAPNLGVLHVRRAAVLGPGERMPVEIEDLCARRSGICALAARGGHLEVLQWLREHGCPWDAWTCELAARGGHLEALQWARANDCPWDPWSAPRPRRVGTWGCYGGRGSTDARGRSGSAFLLLGITPRHTQGVPAARVA